MMAGLFLLFTLDILLIIGRKHYAAIAVTLITIVLCLWMFVFHITNENLPIQL